MAPATKLPPVIGQQDVEMVVSCTMGSAKILGYDLEPFTKIKTGCLGTHLLLTVRVKSRDDKVRAHTCFVKIQPECPMIQDILMDNNTFSEETHFFSQIYPLMIENYRGERWSPKCYLAKDDALIFEDLRAQGYLLRSNPMLDESSLRLAMAALARFHASSLAVEARLGRRLDEAYPGWFTEKMYTKHSKFGRGTLVGYDTIALMADRFGLDSSLVPRIYEWAYKRVRPEENRYNVICHGDLWKNNLLFNDDEQKCVLVDFQLLRYASLAVDICMLLHLHTTPENRRKWESGLLGHYYASLHDHLVQIPNCPGIRIPKYEDIMKEYCEHRLVGMAYASIYVPGVAMDPDDLAEMMNDPVRVERWFFQTRLDYITKNIEKSPDYEKLLKSIVTELFEEARRVLSQ